MSKKKMNALICLCLVISFAFSMILNYKSAMQNEASDFNRNADYMLNTLSEKLPYDKSDFSAEKNCPAIKGGQCTYPELFAAQLQMTLSVNHIPYVFGFINTAQEIAAQSKITCIEESHDGNYIYKPYNYIDLSSYINAEQKESIRKIIKDYPSINSVGIKTDTNGRNIPTEILLGDYITANTFTEGFSLENGVTEKTISPFSSPGNIMHLNSYDLQARSYEIKIYDELEHKLRDFAANNHMFHSGGGFSDADENERYEPVNIDGEDYMFYFYAKINLPMRALSSDFFSYLTEQLLIMYAVLAALIFLTANRLYTKTEKLNKSKRTFISAAAHELKTPLTVIQNQCECILEGAVEDKKDEYIKSVYDEALRMNDIVTSLLTFNRLSSTDKIEKESCNLSALVKEEVEKYLPFALSAGAEISLKAEESLIVTCNPKLMALAVDNYLSNAVKYTTGEKRINVTLKTEKDSFILEVFNTCEPLSKETAESIWNLFERQDASRTRDGSSTGMGLPICKRIFDCHGYGYSCKNTASGVIFSVKGKI